MSDDGRTGPDPGGDGDELVACASCGDAWEVSSLYAVRGATELVCPECVQGYIDAAEAEAARLRSTAAALEHAVARLAEFAAAVIAGRARRARADGPTDRDRVGFLRAENAVLRRELERRGP